MSNEIEKTIQQLIDILAVMQEEYKHDGLTPAQVNAICQAAKLLLPPTVLAMSHVNQH